MQIKREFAGLTITINLTDDELFEAYQIQQRLFDIESVHQELENLSDSELIKRYGLPMSALESLEDAIAAVLRCNLNPLELFRISHRPICCSRPFQR